MSKWMIQLLVLLVVILVVLTLLKWIFAAAWLILRFVVVLGILGGVGYFIFSRFQKR